MARTPPLLDLASYTLPPARHTVGRGGLRLPRAWRAMVGVGLAACRASLRAIAAVLVGAAWIATRARRGPGPASDTSVPAELVDGRGRLARGVGRHDVAAAPVRPIGVLASLRAGEIRTLAKSARAGKGSDGAGINDPTNTHHRVSAARRGACPAPSPIPRRGRRTSTIGWSRRLSGCDDAVQVAGLETASSSFHREYHRSR
jgi:hypothetical protein